MSLNLLFPLSGCDCARASGWSDRDGDQRGRSQGDHSEGGDECIRPQECWFGCASVQVPLICLTLVHLSLATPIH